MELRHLVLIAALLGGTGCTAIGMDSATRDTLDYGAPQELRVCLLKTEDVPEDRADTLIAALKASRPPQSDFFPGMDAEGKFLLTRADVTATLRQYLAERQQEQQEQRQKRLPPGTISVSQ